MNNKIILTVLHAIVLLVISIVTIDGIINNPGNFYIYLIILIPAAIIFTMRMINFYKSRAEGVEEPS